MGPSGDAPTLVDSITSAVVKTSLMAFCYKTLMTQLCYAYTHLRIHTYTYSCNIHTYGGSQ